MALSAPLAGVLRAILRALGLRLRAYALRAPMSITGKDVAVSGQSLIPDIFIL